jgi:MipA family protein
MSIVSGTPRGPVVLAAAGLICAAAVRADEAPAPPADKFEGAVGLVLEYKPAFNGSSDFKLKPHLAGFLRYGRFTVTGAGGFTTKRQDDVERGLDAELVRREGLRMNLSLRVDNGRRESASDQLIGMGDIRMTVRARLGVRWDITPRWQASAATSVDALNRVGGYVVSTGLSYTQPLDQRQRLIYSGWVGGAGDRYLQAWYGVTPAQSIASGYPVYEPKEGLSETGLAATWRIEIDPQWAGFAGVSASRLLGGAAASPLTRQRNGWSISSGLARRF